MTVHNNNNTRTQSKTCFKQVRGGREMSTTDHTNLAGNLVEWNSGFMAREITDNNIVSKLATP